MRLLDPLLGTADALDDDSFDIVGLMAYRDSLLIMSSAKFDNFQKIAWKFSLENCLVCYSYWLRAVAVASEQMLSPAALETEQEPLRVSSEQMPSPAASGTEQEPSPAAFEQMLPPACNGSEPSPAAPDRVRRRRPSRA